MPQWLMPAIKLVANNLDTIVHTARPFLTRRKDAETEDSTNLVQQQIAELQAAALENANQVHELAEQLKTTITALENGVRLAEERAAMSRRLNIAALSLAALALLLALIGLFR